MIQKYKTVVASIISISQMNNETDGNKLTDTDLFGSGARLKCSKEVLNIVTLVVSYLHRLTGKNVCLIEKSKNQE